MTATAESATQNHITSTDAADLRWYFETGRRQIEGSSNFGAMLDRMKHYGAATKPCLKCGGVRAVVEDGETVIAEKVGSGFVWSSEEWKRREQLRKLGLLDESWKGDLVCPACNGRGVILNTRRHKYDDSEVMNVNETRCSSGDDCAGGNASLARLGHISRLLDSVKRLSHSAAQALEAFYSPGGGSEACLWHLTAAGKTMLRRNSMNLPERQFFENERNRQAENPNVERKLLFQAADNQAREVRERMVSVWVRVRK